MTTVKLNWFRMSGRFLLATVICAFVTFCFQMHNNVRAEDVAGTIIIGDDDEVTGAYAATTYCHAQASQDYWKQHNHRIKVDGNIYKIKHMFSDNKSEVSISVSNFHRFAGAGAVIVRTNWTPGMIALKPLGERAKIPILGGGFNKELFIPPSNYLYGAQPSYPGLLCASVKWYKQNVWKGSSDEKMKVGLLLWDTGFGRASDIDPVYNYLEKDLGVEVLPTIFFPVKINDFTPQLMKLKNQDVDLVYMQALVAQYAMLAKDAKRLHMTPEVGLMSTLWCMSSKYVELAGDAAEGTYGPWQWYVAKSDDNPSNPVVQKVHDAMEKYRGDRYYDINYFQGWTYQYLIHHILERTIKKYGFPITGEQVAECASTLPEWDWGLSSSFSGYKGGDRLGWHEVRMYKVQDGEVVPASDWLPSPPELLERAPWIVGK